MQLPVVPSITCRLFSLYFASVCFRAAIAVERGLMRRERRARPHAPRTKRATLLPSDTNTALAAGAIEIDASGNTSSGEAGNAQHYSFVENDNRLMRREGRRDRKAARHQKTMQPSMNSQSSVAASGAEIGASGAMHAVASGNASSGFVRQLPRAATSAHTGALAHRHGSAGGSNAGSSKRNSEGDEDDSHDSGSKPATAFSAVRHHAAKSERLRERPALAQVQLSPTGDAYTPPPPVAIVEGSASAADIERRSEQVNVLKKRPALAQVHLSHTGDAYTPPPPAAMVERSASAVGIQRHSEQLLHGADITFGVGDVVQKDLPPKHARCV